MSRTDYDNGTFCGDKRFTLTWVLVQAVLLAAWLTDPFGRKSKECLTSPQE